MGYPLVICYTAELLKMAIEIVDLPMKHVSLPEGSHQKHIDIYPTNQSNYIGICNEIH